METAIEVEEHKQDTPLFVDHSLVIPLRITSLSTTTASALFPTATGEIK